MNGYISESYNVFYIYLEFFTNSSFFTVFPATPHIIVLSGILYLKCGLKRSHFRPNIALF